MKSLVATAVAAHVTASSGRLQIANVAANLFGGRHRGEWVADFAGLQPEFGGSGRVERLSLAQVSAAMDDEWASGTADVIYRVQFSGQTVDAMLSSANADAEFTWNNGLLNHLVLATGAADGAQALRFARFRGHARLKNGLITIEQSKIETSSGIYQISGTASVKRALSLKLALGTARRYSVEGTLQAPQVIAETDGSARPASSPPAAGAVTTAAPPRSGPGLTQ